MTLPLTKTLDPSDLNHMGTLPALVDNHFTRARPQHEYRRWEYSLALYALAQWTREHVARVVYDVGGAGSPFRHMLFDALRYTLRLERLEVIDPEEPSGQTLEQFVVEAPRLADAVFCLSVLEHVDDLWQFLYHLSCLVRPGGLLFLTMDCWNRAGPDTAHFHWMRKRIFRADGPPPPMSGFLFTDPTSWAGLVCEPFFSPLGPADWTYHGDHVYDYSFCSLALVKHA